MRAKKPQTRQTPGGTVKMKKASTTAPTVASIRRGSKNSPNIINVKKEKIKTINIKAKANSQSEVDNIIPAKPKVTSLNEESMELEVKKKNDNSLTPKRIAGKVNKQICTSKSITINKKPQKMSKQKMVEKQQQTSGKSVRPKICNKELKNLGINLNQLSDSVRGGKFSTVDRDDECKASICEIVKTKSRTASSQVIYGVVTKKTPVITNLSLKSVDKLAPITRPPATKELEVQKRANNQEILTTAMHCNDNVENSKSITIIDNSLNNLLKKNENKGRKSVASTINTKCQKKKKKQINYEILTKKIFNPNSEIDSTISKKDESKMNKIHPVHRKNSPLNDIKPKKITEVNEDSIVLQDSEKESFKNARTLKKEKKQIKQKHNVDCNSEKNANNTSSKIVSKKIDKPKVYKEKGKIFVKDIELLKEQPKTLFEIVPEIILENRKLVDQEINSSKAIKHPLKVDDNIIKINDGSVSSDLNKKNISNGMKTVRSEKKKKTLLDKGKNKVKATPFAIIVKRKYVRKSNFKSLSKPIFLKKKEIPIISAPETQQTKESEQIENILVETQIKISKDIYDFNESGSSSETIGTVNNEDSKQNPIYKREKTLSKDSRELNVITYLNDIKNEENFNDKKEKYLIGDNVSSKIRNDNISAETATENFNNEGMSKFDNDQLNNERITVNNSENMSELIKNSVEDEQFNLKVNKCFQKKKVIFTDDKSDLIRSAKKYEITESQSDVKLVQKQKKTSLIKKTEKLSTLDLTTDKDDTNVKQESEKNIYAEADDDENDYVSECSIKTKAPRKRKPIISKSQRIKLLNLWNGPKKHRVASLNALAKVQCLYENESRTAQELGLLKTAQSPIKERTLSSSSEDTNGDDKTNDSNNISTRLLRNGPGMRGIGKHWEMDETSSTGDQLSAIESDTSYVQGRIERPKIKKKPLPKKVIKPKLKQAPKKKPIKHTKRSNSQCSFDNKSDTGDDNDSIESTLPLSKKTRNNLPVPAFDVNEVIVSKRMASLNASAMLAASYEVDHHLDRDTDETTSEEGSSDEEASPSLKKSKEIKNENDDCKDSKEMARPVSTSVVIVQDTDVTITGVYVNSSLGASQEAAYCKMQYRVQSSVTEERVLHAPSSTLPEQPPKSYTPLGALSSMRPPGAHDPAQQQHQQQPSQTQHLHYPNSINQMGHSHQPIQPQYVHHGSHPHSQYLHHMTNDPITSNCSESPLSRRQTQRSSPFHQITPVVIVNQSSPQAPTLAAANSILNVGQNPSAFCSPPQHQPLQHHENTGYYQPAGPLISPHILPQQSGKTVSQPLDSDSLQLQQPPPPSSAAESSDSDVLITGSDLAPRPQTFRYTPTASSANQSQDSLSGSGYSRSTIHQMHCPTYPPSYYTPYAQHHPPQDMCYSPTYQPYFPTQKVYPSSSPYRRYVTTAGSYYQTAGPPPQLGDHIYDTPQPSSAQATTPSGTQLVPAGPSGLHNIDHHYTPYYSGYSSNGSIGGVGGIGTGSIGGSQCYSTRTIQPSYMDASLPPYPGSCPCPMQSCPKNVHTGPLIGSNKTGKGPVQQSGHHHHLVASLDSIAQATTSIQQPSMLNINQNNDNSMNKITCKTEIMEARISSHPETSDKISSYHQSVNGLSPIIVDSINGNSNGSIVVGDRKDVQYEKVALAPLANYSMNHKVMEPEMSISPARGSTGLPLPPTPASAVQPTDSTINTPIVRKARIGKTMARERQMKMMCHAPITMSNAQEIQNKPQHRQEQFLFIQNQNQQKQQLQHQIFSNELQNELSSLKLKQEIFDIKMECVKSETEDNVVMILDNEIIEEVEKKENCQKKLKMELEERLGFLKPKTQNNLFIDKKENELIEIKLEKTNTYDDDTINVDESEPDIPAATVKRRKLLNSSPYDPMSFSPRKKSPLDGYKSLIKRTEPKPYLLTPSKPRLLSDIMRNRSRANAKRKYQQTLRFKARLASHKRARQKKKLLANKEKSANYIINKEGINSVEDRKTKQNTNQLIEKCDIEEPDIICKSKNKECTKNLESRLKPETTPNKSQMKNDDSQNITGTSSQINKSKIYLKGYKLKAKERKLSNSDVKSNEEIDDRDKFSNTNNANILNSSSSTSIDLLGSKQNLLNKKCSKLPKKKSKSGILLKKVNQISSKIALPSSNPKCKKSLVLSVYSVKKDFSKEIEKNNIETKSVTNKTIVCHAIPNENLVLNTESSKKKSFSPLSSSYEPCNTNNNNLTNDNNNNSNHKILQQNNYDPHHFDIHHPQIIRNLPVKRNRSRGTKFSNRKRHRIKIVREIEEVQIPRRCTTAPRWSNGWSWEGEPYQGKVFLNSDDSSVSRTCYTAMRHLEGDVIRPRDCVLLRAGNKRIELPYVAKVAHLWENPEDGEMMMSLLWYYRPEHTERGRQQSDCIDEVFASRHKDHNSVACIEDKCYVLTFNEYCRYRRQLKCYEENIEEIPSIVPQMFLPNYDQIMSPYIPRRIDIPTNTSIELVMFCRRVYDFRLKRLSKNPS